MKKYIVLLALILFCGTALKGQQVSTSISGRLPFLKEGDTIMLVVYRYGHFKSLQDFQRKVLFISP